MAKIIPLGDNEKMIAKIKEKGYYHIQIKPVNSISITFEDLDLVLNDSVLPLQGNHFPGIAKFHNSGDFYICKTHRISHIYSNIRLEAWNCSTVGRFEMYESYIEDLSEEYADKKFLDFDHCLKIIIQLIIFASNYSQNLQRDIELKIDLYDTKSRQMKSLYNQHRDLTGNFICHASEINISPIIIGNPTSQDIYINSKKCLCEIFPQFQILDDGSSDISFIIKKYIEKNFIPFLETINKKFNKQ